MFRFIDRWQTSLRDAWVGKRDEELFRLLEQRDQQLEDQMSGGSWANAYTPALDQGGAVALTVNTSDLQVVHGMAFWSFYISITGTGSAGSAVRLQLPTNATGNLALGYGMVYDASTTTRHFGGWEQDPGYNYARFASDTSAGNLWGIVPSIALASGDQLRGNLIYRVAKP